MKVALVAMPWPPVSNCVNAIGALSAYLKQQAPHVQVLCSYPYVTLRERIRPLYDFLEESDFLGEMLYAALIYPDKRTAVGRHLCSEAAGVVPEDDDCAARLESLLENDAALVFDEIDAHLKEVARDIALFDLVGFTLTYNQTFASVAVCRQMKQLNPSIKTVLGGLCAGQSMGQSLLSEYDCIDAVVQGEGEIALLELVRSLEAGDWLGRPIQGVTERAAFTKDAPPVWNHKPAGNSELVADLNDLPVPDYDAYAELASRYGHYWIIPVEGARGCWWNRKEPTGDATKACFFCDEYLGSYRAKTPQRVATETKELTSRYKNPRVVYTDASMRKSGLLELAAALRSHQRDYAYCLLMRPTIHPREILALWESGCFLATIGIEGFSSAYLRRIGKGTLCIHNLQAMRTCFELGIDASGLLVTEFPGTPPEEIEDTARNIRDFACAYQPVSVSPFDLHENSTLCSEPERFSVNNVRNAATLKLALPDQVWQRLRLYWLDFDRGAEPASWEPVTEALEHWVRLHDRLQKEDGLFPLLFGARPLCYLDAGDFLEILDRRDGRRRRHLLGNWQELYLYCTEIRSLENLFDHFAGRIERAEIRDMVDRLHSERLMFVEEERCLSLAVATRPWIAAERIRRMSAEENSTGLSRRRCQP